MEVDAPRKRIGLSMKSAPDYEGTRERRNDSQATAPRGGQAHSGARPNHNRGNGGGNGGNSSRNSAGGSAGASSGNDAMAAALKAAMERRK